MSCKGLNLKILTLSGVLLLTLSGLSFGLGEYSSEYYADIEQPVDFNHETHVLTNGIACEACHTQARVSNSAGTPSVASCVGCHIVIRGTTEEQQAEIAKVNNFWKNSQSIPWKKVHDLPDFVIFSHKAHIRAGFDCTECHGDVGKTKIPVPQEYSGEIPLSMGWCVSCHRTDWPVTAANKISTELRATRGGLITGDAPPAIGHVNGPLDCLICHK